MFSFGRKKTAVLGVDISSTTIKLIELVPDQRRLFAPCSTS